MIPMGVQKIENKAFYANRNLTDISMPKSVTDIGIMAFMGCWNLKAIEFPESIERIGEYAFDGCERLAETTIPKNITLLYKNSFPAETMLYVYKESHAHSYAADNGMLHSVIALENFGQNSACIRVMSEENTKCDVTLLSGIDALKYKAMGFMVTTGGVTTNYDINTVYNALNVLNADGTRVNVLPTEFGEKAQYIFAITLPFGEEYSEETLMWRPYAVDLNGNNIYGKESTISPIFK